MNLRRTGVQGIYRTLSPVYVPIRSLWAQTLSRQAERFLDHVALPAALYPAARILDLGCGPGINPARLHRLNLPYTSYVGIDFSSAMLKRVVAKRSCNHSYALSDAHALPFETGAFDVVLSTWMFSHLSDPTNVVMEALRLLSPTGRMVIACYSRGSGPIQMLQHQVETLFWMRCVPRAEFYTWPGLVELKSFANGWNTVVILRKEC